MKFKLDLSKLIYQAMPQVADDQRPLLQQWLDRNSHGTIFLDEQPVEIDLAKCLIIEQADDCLYGRCPVCGSCLRQEDDGSHTCCDCGFYTGDDEEEETCGYCSGANLQMAAEYIWCPDCNTGTFFGACPGCKGNLDASLDPLAKCYKCHREWGSPSAASIAVALDVISSIDPVILPRTNFQKVDDLRAWLATLAIQENTDDC